MSMSGTHVLAQDQQDRVLDESAQHERFAVLTHHGPEGWRLLKGRFVPNEQKSTSLHFVIPWPNGNRSALLPEPGESIGCTFRVGHKKCMFESTVDQAVRLPEAASVILRWPSQVQQLQRRVFERSTPPPSNIIAVRFWRERNDTANESGLRDVRHGQLEDISAGGLRIKVARPQDIEDGALYRCIFTAQAGKPAFLLDAILRHREAAEEGRASLGFQIVGLEATADGRRTLDRLARLISHFQRAAHRRRN